MKTIFITLLLFVLVASVSSCSPGQVFEPTSTPSPIIPATLTPTQTDTPTTEPTITATPKPTPSDFWQLSPDGHVYYNESELYGGLFTINKEHPEYVEAFWEKMVSGLWNLNYISENNRFLSQFPTSDSLLKYLKNGGGPVSNLWIPVIYPNAKQEFYFEATMVPVEGKVDLSKIEISIYKPTKDEIYTASPSYASGTKFISIGGMFNRLLVEETDNDSENILRFTFRRDILADTQYTIPGEGSYTFYALTGQKSGQENLLAVSQLLNCWLYTAQMPKVFPDDGALGWMKTYSPPLLNVNSYAPTSQQRMEFANIEGSPLMVR